MTRSEVDADECLLGWFLLGASTIVVPLAAVALVLMVFRWRRG